MSDTTLFDGRDMHRIYCVRYNYVLRHLTMAIFRLRNEKNLVSSYTRLMWAVYSGEVIDYGIGLQPFTRLLGSEGSFPAEGVDFCLLCLLCAE